MTEGQNTASDSQRSAPASIDHTTPVIAHHEIDISAPLDRVWALHVNPGGWPTWQSDITAAELRGDFAQGGSFTWTSYGFTVTSTLYAVEDEARTLWGGAAEWADTGKEIMGIHEWLFTATATGTHVETNESFAGEPVEADSTGLKQQLDGSLISWMNHLKSTRPCFALAKSATRPVRLLVSAGSGRPGERAGTATMGQTSGASRGG